MITTEAIKQIQERFEDCMLLQRQGRDMKADWEELRVRIEELEDAREWDPEPGIARALRQPEGVVRSESIAKHLDEIAKQFEQGAFSLMAEALAELLRELTCGSNETFEEDTEGTFCPRCRDMFRRWLQRATREIGELSGLPLAKWYGPE